MSTLPRAIAETTHAGTATTELLDHPIWAALTTKNRGLAEGGPLALRYLPDVAPFAAIADRTAASFAALIALMPPQGRLALGSDEPMVPPAGLVVDTQMPVLQMVLDAPITSTPSGPEHVTLGRTDVPDMMDLVGRTRPGPFGTRTIELGRYIGLRAEGVLAAMAGERMRFDRFVEISAVCVDPAHRGKGYAALLVTRLARDIQAQGLTPFLHVFTANQGAIALYEKLGFVARRRLCITSLRASLTEPVEASPHQS